MLIIKKIKREKLAFIGLCRDTGKAILGCINLGRRLRNAIAPFRCQTSCLLSKRGYDKVHIALIVSRENVTSLD